MNALLQIGEHLVNMNANACKSLSVVFRKYNKPSQGESVRAFVILYVLPGNLNSQALRERTGRGGGWGGVPEIISPTNKYRTRKSSCVNARGTPPPCSKYSLCCSVWGVPRVPPWTWDGVPPRTWHGVPPGPGMGYPPYLDLGWGTPPYLDLGWGTPLPRPGMGYPHTWTWDGVTPLPRPEMG